MEKNLTLVALFAALIAALGLLPKLSMLGGVPITAQSMGIMLAGTVLGARRGALAVLLFLGLVALGLPLLAGGRGGLGVFAGPTVGYLIGFPIAAFVTGWLCHQWRGLPSALGAGLAAFLGGAVVLNVIGLSGVMLVLDMPLRDATLLGLSFLPGDAIKAVLTGVLSAALWRARPGLIRP